MGYSRKTLQNALGRLEEIDNMLAELEKPNFAKDAEQCPDLISRRGYRQENLKTIRRAPFLCIKRSVGIIRNNRPFFLINIISDYPWNSVPSP